MNKSRLLIAVAVLIGLSVAVGLTTRSRSAKTTVDKPVATVPAIKKEEITAIEIEKPGQPKIVLQKQGEKWGLTAPVSADAEQWAIDSALDKLSDLTVTSVAATRKENYGRLQVDDAQAVRVKVKGGDKQLADLRVGASKSGGTMVRVEGQEPVLAVRGSIRFAFDKQVKDFRKKEITHLDAKELSAISLSSEKGNFKFERAPKAAAAAADAADAGVAEEQAQPWQQAKGEKPIAKFDPEKVDSLASTLGNLRAADFAEPSEGEEVTGLSAPLSKITVTKTDGSTLEVALGKQHASGNDYYLRTNTSPVIFRIGKYTGERLMPEPKFFEKSEKPANAPQAGGAPGMPIAGGGQLPPDVMQQLQRQMQAQGGSPH